MTNPHVVSMTALTLLTACILATPTARADSASGSVNYQSKAGPVVVNVTNVYLVKGPDAVSGKAIRKLIFSAKDMSAKVKSCATMSCPDGDLDAGMTVDLDAGPRLNYWVVGNGQRVQYSGTAKPDALTLTTNSPQRLAGTLAIDDSGAGGAKVNVNFDATLAKEYAK
jgi:hypothetical protein